MEMPRKDQGSPLGVWDDLQGAYVALSWPRREGRGESGRAGRGEEDRIGDETGLGVLGGAGGVLRGA